LEKTAHSDEDLRTLETLIQFTRDKGANLKLHDLCSLVYSYVSLSLYRPQDIQLLEKIKLGIIGKVTTEEIANDLRHRTEVQKAIESRDWLLLLPAVFAEKFDQCLYFLGDVLEEFKHIAFKEFYTFLENIVKIAVEFNARMLWPDDWKIRLGEAVTAKDKPFEKFTFGDLFQSLRTLKNEQATYCKDIPEATFDILSAHLEIRNNLTHEFIAKLPSFDIVRDISKIVLVLLDAFPRCIKVISTKDRPWYHIEILWGQLPKRASAYSDKDLTTDGYYYIEPNPEIMENRLHPKILMPINEETTQILSKRD
jgi:hypothetical protein